MRAELLLVLALALLPACAADCEPSAHAAHARGRGRGRADSASGGPIPLGALFAPYLAWTGQSGALGNNTTAQSTTQPYDNRRWNGSDHIALVETTLESPVSGAANQITYLDAGNDRVSVSHNWAVAATAYSGLALGTGRGDRSSPRP